MTSTGRDTLHSTCAPSCRSSPRYVSLNVVAASSRVFGVPPAEASVDRVFVDGAPQPLGPLTDHRADTGYAGSRRPFRTITVRVDPVQAVVSRSVTLLGRRALPSVVRVEVTPAVGTTSLQPRSSITETGSTLSIALGDRHVRSIAVTFAPTGRGTPLTLSELWATRLHGSCSSRTTAPDGCATSAQKVAVLGRSATLTRSSHSAARPRYDRVDRVG